MLPQRISLVTVGVSDVERSRKFYEGLGFRAADFDSESVTFFDMNGFIFAIFGRADLAEDANVAIDDGAFSRMSLAINLDSESAVDAAMEFAASKGGRVTQPARKVFWGGYAGYFADPDGHLWEIAYNPFWPLDAEGRPQIPPPRLE